MSLWDGDSALDAVLEGYGHDTITADERGSVLPLYLFAFIVPHAVRLVDANRRELAGEHIARTRYERLL